VAYHPAMCCVVRPLPKNYLFRFFIFISPPLTSRSSVAESTVKAVVFLKSGSTCAHDPLSR
jgi:hypothetical protein